MIKNTFVPRSLNALHVIPTAEYSKRNFEIYRSATAGIFANFLDPLSLSLT